MSQIVKVGGFTVDDIINKVPMKVFTDERTWSCSSMFEVLVIALSDLTLSRGHETVIECINAENLGIRDDLDLRGSEWSKYVCVKTSYKYDLKDFTLLYIKKGIGIEEIVSILEKLCNYFKIEISIQFRDKRKRSEIREI